MDPPGSLGPPTKNSPESPAVNLQAVQRQIAVSKTCREGEEMHRAPHTASQPASSSDCISQSPPSPHQISAAVEEGRLPSESAEFDKPHTHEAKFSYLRHSGNSINLCTAKEIVHST